MPRSRATIQADIDAADLEYRLQTSAAEAATRQIQTTRGTAAGPAAVAAHAAALEARAAKRDAIRALTVELKAAELADGVPADVVRDTIRHPLNSKEYI